MAKSEADVDSFLTEHEARVTNISRCTTCNKFPRVTAALEKFFAKKRDGSTSVVLRYFFDRFLVPTLGYKASFGALRRHVIECMKLNASTGAKLE